MSKIKILFLAANPAATKPLQLDEEIREITAKIRASEYRDSLELISWWAVRPDDLLQTLLEHKPHIVHFSGHGSPTSEIILQDQNGRPQSVSKEALVHLFRTLKDNLRLVLFNACSTRPQAEAIAQTIDCTVGMNQPIGDDAAIVFAASFYRAIGFGRTVQEAFDLAKVALLLEGIPEHKTPETYVRGRCRRLQDDPGHPSCPTRSGCPVPAKGRWRSGKYCKENLSCRRLSKLLRLGPV